MILFFSTTNTEEGDTGQAIFSEELHGSDGVKPYIGLMLDSVEKAWEVWTNYDKTMGFGVRK